MNNPDTQAIKFDPMAVLGSTGLRQYGGYITEEFLKELAGLRAAKTYREMVDNDDTVGGVIFAITSLIRQATWNVQAKDATPEAEDAKAFVEEVLADMSMSFSAVIEEICSMFVYGFAPMEIVWKRRNGIKGDGAKSAHDDGKIGVRSIQLRGQATIQKWGIDEADGSILSMIQQPWAGTAVTIPIEKLLLFRTTTERNNPEGRSILRTAYRSYYFRKRLEEIEAIGIERDMAGIPVAYVPGSLFAADAPPEDKQVLAQWQTLVTSIRRDTKEGIVLPSSRDQSGQLMYELKLLSTSGSRAVDTTKVIDRYKKQIATSVLADFIFLGQQAVGSFALSSDKTALFATALGAFANSIADVFNRHLLTRLFDLNGIDRAFMPTLHCGDLETPNVAELGQFLTALVGAGVALFPDRELENHLRDMVGLPLAPEDDGGVDGGDAASAADAAAKAQALAAAEALDDA